MTKILLVISKYLPEYTGAAYRIDGLYRRLQKADETIEVEILCNSTTQVSSERYNHNGFNVKRVVCPWQLSWMPSRVKNAVKKYYEAVACWCYLRRTRPDILHIVGFSGATTAALLYGGVRRIPRLVELVTAGATPRQYLPGLRYSARLNLDSQTVIIAISQKLANDCRDINLVHNVWCRPNPINGDKCSLVSSEIKDQLRAALSPFHKDDIVITMVAKFMPQKNQIFMVEVLKHLSDDYKLLLAGPRAESGMFKQRDQKYFEDLLCLIKENNLEHRVHICTEFVEASDYMKAADIYVMPQHTEGLGTPMLEAMACGLPVVANADEPAFREWVKDGQNGYLCKMQPEEWAEMLTKSLEISAEKLEKSARHIHDVASVTQCDMHYISLLNALKKTSPNETLKVCDVL
ncbi:MAG: hypothetical protein COA45_03825 [Zetaproteobacteria bacterium]|nr:MAG: hypothetical protein COA45_03825 [Zetaproteobacteria bacterium]